MNASCCYYFLRTFADQCPTGEVSFIGGDEPGTYYQCVQGDGDKVLTTAVLRM